MDKDHIRIACVGDSITYGLKLEDRLDDSYPSTLGRMLQMRGDGDGGRRPAYRVGNYGVSGACVWRRRSRRYADTPEYADAAAWCADVYVVCLGTNDVPGKTAGDFDAEFAEGYRSLLDGLREHRPEAALCLSSIPPIPGYPELAGTVDRVNGIIARLAREYGAVLVDVHGAFLGRVDLFTDGVHPNVAGARLMAETVFAALECLLPPELEGTGIVPLPGHRPCRDFFPTGEAVTIRDEDGARPFLESFWRAMPSTRLGCPVIDPNDLLTLFRRRNELVVLPAIRVTFGGELAERILSVLLPLVEDGDAVLLALSATGGAAEDWALERLLADRLRAAAGSRSRLFLAPVTDGCAPQDGTLWAGVSILKAGDGIPGRRN